MVHLKRNGAIRKLTLYPIVFVYGLGSFLSSTQARAEIFTCGVHAPYYAGLGSSFASHPHTYEGTAADIRYRQAALCRTDNTSNNVSLSWTMISSHNAQGWSQSGYGYWPGFGCWKHFAQEKRGLAYNPVTITGACVNAGELHKAWQQSFYVGGAQGWSMRSNIDTTVFIQSDWNQFGAWTTPFEVNFMTETKYNESDVPGLATTQTEFGSPGHVLMQVQDFTTNSWNDTCGYINLVAHADARYAEQTISCDYARAWTVG